VVSYTIDDASGGKVAQTATVSVTGTNDAPLISGAAVGAVTEDTATATLTDTGTLTISDADTGEAVFQTACITASEGALGSLSITTAGVWTYSVANAAVQYLGLDDTKVETFTVLSADGTAHDVVVTIIGTNNRRPDHGSCLRQRSCI
jgi:VCBS repeat-containing protein